MPRSTLSFAERRRRYKAMPEELRDVIDWIGMISGWGY